MTDLLNQIEGMLTELNRYREDWPRWYVLADAYEESGDEERSEAIRWLGENKKRPGSGGGAAVWQSTKSDNWKTHCGSVIPKAIMTQLKGKGATPYYYPDLKSALEDFVTAYHKAKAKGWKP